MVKQRPVTAMEVAFRNAGPRQGMMALSWVLEWGGVRALGQFDGAGTKSDRVHATGRWYGYSDAKSWKRQKAFVTAFPGFACPDDLLDLPGNEALREFFDSAAAVGRKAAVDLARGMPRLASAVVS